AEVELDGAAIGRTPLPRNGVVGKLPLGKHRLRVTAPGGAPDEDQIDVHFQKVSPGVVPPLPSSPSIPTAPAGRPPPQPIYSRTWFIVAVGVVAVGLGAAIGYRAGHVKVCQPDPQGMTPGC